jgi:hypothetical protein
MARDLARVAIDKMRGGPLLAVSPERSEAILAAAFEQLIATAIDATKEAVAAEREACAKLADKGIGNNNMCIAEAIALAIRTRGAK